LKNFGNGRLGKDIWWEVLGEEEAMQPIRGGQVVA